jgi:hypothetical protein
MKNYTKRHHCENLSPCLHSACCWIYDSNSIVLFVDFMIIVVVVFVAVVVVVTV